MASAAPSVAVEAPRAEARRSPFELLGDAPRSYYGFVGAMLFESDDRLGLAEGTSIVYRPELSRGLPPGVDIEATGGVWPTSAWLAASMDGGGSALYRYRGDRWFEDRALHRPLTTTYHIAAFPKGRAILVRAPRRGGRLQVTSPPGFDIAGSAPGERIPKLQGPRLLSPTALRTRPDGTIVIAGNPISDIDITSEASVERWDPGSARGELEALPGGEEGRVHDLCLVPPRRTIVIGASKEECKIWLHDGTAWTVERPPPGTECAGSVCAADGSVFTLVGDAVLRRLGPGRWETIDLPSANPPFAAKSLRAGESGALWVTATRGNDSRYVLLRMPLPGASRVAP